VLSAGEFRAIYGGFWQLFAPRRIYIPGTAAVAGGTEYTITPSGSIVFSGGVSQVRDRTLAPSGAIAFSGAPVQIHTRVQIPSGSVTLSGAVSQVHEHAIPTAGSVVFSGSAPITTSAVYQITPSGEIVFSGAPSQVHEKIVSASGQLVFSGAAGMIYIPAGGVASSDYQRISVGLGRASRLS